MNNPSATARMTRTLIAIAAAISVLAFVNGGTDRGIAATVGATLSVANWLLLRWLGTRIFKARGGERALVSSLLIAKIGLLMAIVYVLINRLHLDPIGLVLGLGVLFVGPVVAGLLLGTGGAQEDPSAASAASEER